MTNQGPYAPRWVGAYELLDRVATSATGSVWRGRDHALGRNVALKQVASGAVRSVAQLRTEARLLARLSHPNIVGVIDLFEGPSELWLVEEWVDGLTLSAVLGLAGRFSAIQAVGAVRGGLLGLDYAHANQVVHGDVSPANLLLDYGGTTRLVDFGLAQPAGGTGVTGTPGYLSPEAAWGLPLMPASDVYSAAAVLVLLLRGRPLFEGPTAEAVLAAQFRPGAVDLSGVAGPIRTVLQAALTPNPAERPAHAGEFLALLDDAAERTFGAGWLAGASVVGLVSAAVTAGVAATAGAPVVAGAALVQAPPPMLPPMQGPPPVIQPAAAGSPDRSGGGALTRHLRRALRSRRLVASIGAGVVAVTATSVILAQHGGSPHAAAANRPPAASSPTAAIRPAAFDLHAVDWDSITLPGGACFTHHDITLHNGKATLPLPPLSPSSGPGGYALTRNGAPQYGQLANGGPKVAVLGVLCTGTGTYAGTGLHTRWPGIAVFAAPAGHVQMLGFYFDGEYGTPVTGLPVTGEVLVPTQWRVQHGVITIVGTYLRGHDGACCPSGRGVTTLSYRNGKLVPTHVLLTGPGTGGPATTPSTPPSPPAATGAGRTISTTGYSGHKYVATVRAEDKVSDCAANSYGAPMINFFQQHPCPSGAGRRLVTIPFNGRTVALSMIAVDAQIGPSSDLYKYAAQLAKLENEAGTGSLDDLLRSGARPAGWPAAIPANEAFVVTGEDDTIYIFDAWYLDGSTANQDPALVKLTQDIFLTSITVGPF
jgi:hypothetical protein